MKIIGCFQNLIFDDFCSCSVGSTSIHEVDSKKHERSRRGKHLGASSDDEGSYQALSVVFQDPSNLNENCVESEILFDICTNALLAILVVVLQLI